MKELWRRCSSKAHVPKWDYVTLEPLDGVKDDGDIEDYTYERDYDALSDALCIDDDSVLIAPLDNQKLVDFYVLKFTTHKKKYDTLSKDAWGNVCHVGPFFVKRVWYKQAKGDLFEF